MLNSSAGFVSILCSNDTVLLLNLLATLLTLTYIGKLLFEFGDTYSMEDGAGRAGTKRSLTNQHISRKLKVTVG